MNHAAIVRIMRSALRIRYGYCLARRKAGFKDFDWNALVARKYGIEAWSKAAYSVFLAGACKSEFR